MERWHVLGRLVRVLPGVDGVSEVAERHKAFVMRYLHARVLCPVAKGWEGAEKKDLAVKEADHQEAERQQSEAYQERKMVALYRRWVGEAVSANRLGGRLLLGRRTVCSCAMTNRHRAWPVVVGLRCCVGGAGERGAEEVTVMRWSFTRRLRWRRSFVTWCVPTASWSRGKAACTASRKGGGSFHRCEGDEAAMEADRVLPLRRRARRPRCHLTRHRCLERESWWVCCGMAPCRQW